MEYELTIEKGKEETIISYLKKFDFVTLRKKSNAKKPAKKKAVKKQVDFLYFGVLPDWDIEAEDLRKNKLRKTKIQW